MLHLHRAERGDRLVDALAAVIGDPLDDPLATEVVAVHSRGIERWLAQELGTRLGASSDRYDGVCANVSFPFPSRVVARGMAVVGGIDPQKDPWSPERLVWPLLEVVEAHLAAEWLAPLRCHLGRPGPPGPAPAPWMAETVGAEADRHGRRFSAARHIADLFDRYAIHRPAMVESWARGRDVDGVGSALEESHLWQPQLWRLVRQRVALPSPAERLTEAVERLRAGAEIPDLPSRVSLFGLTALPASYAAILAAMASHRDLHLFLLHPSPVLWQRIAQDRRRPLRTTMRREDDPTREAPRNPLLASWGRDARELQLVVTSLSGEVVDDHRPLGRPPRPECGTVTTVSGADRGGGEPATLLQTIQADVRADRPPPGPPLEGGRDERRSLAPGDRSLQVHSCHGRTRQVEVLRDAILHLLAEDHTLEPRDVVVMCPDIEAYAPIVHAVFGVPARPAPEAEICAEVGPGEGVSEDDLPDLRVRLADRAIRQTNPVLRAVAELLTLAGGRLTASEVLGFVSCEPVRRRFRFADDDLQRLNAWVAEAGIRWGLDADHRAMFGLPGIVDNTWRAGLDRLLSGVTMADEDQRLVGGTVPLDDVEGAAVDLAGRFAEFIHRLADILASFAAPQPLGAWRDAIGVAADRLTLTSEPDRWQQVQLHRLLDDVVAEATLEGSPWLDQDADGGTIVSSPSPVELTLAEVRSLLEDRLRGRPSRANHRTGDLTVCTLVPMRAVPHRVICLLGMDDGAFPRRTAPDGDDLVDVAPRVGDRDPRTEDRQLLLDALLAAADHLVITYSGRDERTNELRPPAAPVDELLDTVDRTVRTDSPSVPARTRVLVEHPLQTFDPRNFRIGELVPGRPWGFDVIALAGAEAKVRGQAEAPAFLARRLPPEGTTTIELAELVRFLEHPVRAFLRHRLGVRLPAPSERATDRIPVELDGIERYALGDALLSARLAGVEMTRWLAGERARGNLPPGALAHDLVADLTTTVDAILGAAGEHADLDRSPEHLDVIVPLPGGRTLVGTMAVALPPRPAHEAVIPARRAPEAPPPGLLLAVQYARVGAAHRLAAWARLLAASAAHPDRTLAAVTIGRSGERNAPVRIARVPPLGGDAETRQRAALDHLTRLVDLYERGMREPLPLYCDTSAAYAEAVHAGDDEPHAAAADTWATGRQRWPKEDRHPEHVLVLGGVVAFDVLCAPTPGGDEQGEGWPDDESSRFGRYARRLWDGLLALEQIEDR